MHFPRILEFFVSDFFFHLHKDQSFFWQLEHGLFWQFHGSSTQGQDVFPSRRGRSFLKKVLSFPFVRQMNCRVHNLCIKSAQVHCPIHLLTHIHTCIIATKTWVFSKHFHIILPGTTSKRHQSSNNETLNVIFHLNTNLHRSYVKYFGQSEYIELGNNHVKMTSLLKDPCRKMKEQKITFAETRVSSLGTALSS